MKTPLIAKARVPVAKLGIVLVVAFAMVFAAMYIAAASPAPSSPRLTLANGSVQQWAFGGSSSGQFSCSNSSCFGNASVNGTASLSWNYYIGWAVIYTVTNVSSTQTMVEVQTAINASASFSLSACFTNGTGPCHQESASLTLSGLESAVGFTNITNGTVNLTASVASPLGNTAAQAIMNAASHESFNFSGSESITGLSSMGSGTGSANFDFGGSETSTVTFSTPLGIVPLNPQPGDQWTSSAPFSATGSWSTGYSISTSVGGHSASNWTSGVVTPSGTETVLGSDIGAFTLYDNYTHPPTVVTGQAILLDFGNETFAGADGWLIVPATLYGGVYGGLLGGVLLSHATNPSALHPAATLSTPTSGETAYYQKGTGFIGAQVAGNTTVPSLGASGPSIKLQAGPEPVSVAQQQYSAITSGSGGSSSSSFPWAIVAIAVVVVLVIVVAVVMLARRRRHPPAAASAGAAGAPVAWSPGTPPSQTAPAPTGPAAPGQNPTSSAPPIPSCPSCGQPGTYIAQYGRYYCYTDKQYL